MWVRQSGLANTLLNSSSSSSFIRPARKEYLAAVVSLVHNWPPKRSRVEQLQSGAPSFRQQQRQQKWARKRASGDRVRRQAGRQPASQQDEHLLPTTDDVDALVLVVVGRDWRRRGSSKAGTTATTDDDWRLKVR